MPDSVKDMLISIDKKLDMHIQEHQSFVKLVDKHEVILAGDGNGNIGLIRRIDGIGSKLDYIQRFAVIIWTAIFTVIQGVMAYFIRHKGA